MVSAMSSITGRVRRAYAIPPVPWSPARARSRSSATCSSQQRCSTPPTLMAANTKSAAFQGGFEIGVEPQGGHVGESDSELLEDGGDGGQPRFVDVVQGDLGHPRQPLITDEGLPDVGGAEPAATENARASCDDDLSAGFAALERFLPPGCRG